MVNNGLFMKQSSKYTKLHFMFVLIAVLGVGLSVIDSTNAYTVVQYVLKAPDDSTYHFGNQDSDFYVEKRDAMCNTQWHTTAGSTSSDDSDAEFSQVLYAGVLGTNGLLYAVGSTPGNRLTSDNENMKTAVVAYNTTDGSLVRYAQFDELNGLDNRPKAIASRDSDGILIVGVYGSVNDTHQETKILQIQPEKFTLMVSHSVSLTSTDEYRTTNGLMLVSMIYERDLNSLVALGHVASRAFLFRFDIDTGSVTDQAEWGSLFGTVTVDGLVSDMPGIYYIAGSTLESILDNKDVTSTSNYLRPYIVLSLIHI